MLCYAMPCHAHPNPPRNLLNTNPPRFPRHHLRHHNGQDTILQARLDGLEIHPPGEAEPSLKLPNRALADPVLGARLRSLLRLGRGRYLSARAGGRLGSSVGSLALGTRVDEVVFDADFLVLGRRFRRVIVVGCGLCRFRDCFVGLGGLGARAAADNERAFVQEFDVEILLVEAWQFALELVGVEDLADVEAGGEGSAGLLARGGGDEVGGRAVEEAEDGREVAA